VAVSDETKGYKILVCSIRISAKLGSHLRQLIAQRNGFGTRMSSSLQLPHPSKPESGSANVSTGKYFASTMQIQFPTTLPRNPALIPPIPSCHRAQEPNIHEMMSCYATQPKFLFNLRSGG